MNIKKRNQIVLEHMNLINSIARSYHGRTLTNCCPMYETQDLVNELILVAMRSTNLYNPRKGKIHPYLRRRMHNHILDLTRAHHHVKIPRTIWKKKKEQGMDSFDQFYRPFSMNKLLSGENIDTFEDMLPCKNISVEEQILLKEFTTICMYAINCLGSNRTKTLIIAHAFHGHNLKSLEPLFGVTSPRLSQIAKKARQVMFKHVKKVYPYLTNMECTAQFTPKSDKRAIDPLGKIETFELIRFVAFLTKD